MSNETLVLFGVEYEDALGFKAKDDNGATHTYTEGGGTPTLQTITKTYTPTESQQTETITAGSGYDGIEEVDVTVNAISSSYVGSNIPRYSSSDLYMFENSGSHWVGGDYGYYASDFEKELPNADAGATSASVQYITENNIRKWKIEYEAYAEEAGWIDDGPFGAVHEYKYNAVPANTTITPTESTQTIGGSNYMMEGAVTVNPIPSQYIVPSGTYSVTSSGNKDVTNYATASVPAGTEGAPTATKGTVSNHAVTVTPSVTNQSGFISGGTHTGTAVSVSASELVSGTYTVDSSGNKDVTNYASASIPSGTAGTPSATKGTVSNHSVSVTPSVTNTTGWITGSTKTGTAVTVSASELVSGTYTVDSSGTKDVTNYASASVPSLTLPSSTSSSRSGTEKAFILPSTSSRYINIPTGFNNTAQYYNIAPMNLAPLQVTENGTYSASIYDVEGFSTVTVNVSGGSSGSSLQTGFIDEPSSMTSSTITFTGLSGEPTAFCLSIDGNLSTGTPAKIAAIVFDGTSLHGQTITNTSNAQVSYDGSSFTKSYSNGTLTVTSTGAQFQTSEAYVLCYTYNGSAANIHTADVQVGSGATSITFTQLDDEPEWWCCIFKSNFSTSSGYQRVIFTNKNTNPNTQNIYGMAMDSSAHINGLYWSASYNNGSLTITSQGTNAGGYFHQPGYYQLTYALADASPYQKKTVTPTTSQQVIEPDTGYDALSQVTVQAIPSTYVQPTSTVGSTTYRASTSNQTINAGTYHSAAATIAAVSQTNLSAENIKSGTTITISNGQSNLWSVTGTYTGSGGGGGGSVGTGSVTNSSASNTSISFTNLSGTPKAFFVRFTGSLTRSSNSSYYYITAIRYNGTNTNGNYWRMSNGTFSNDTTHYSYTYSNGTLTVSSSASRSSAGGSFYNGTYELTYFY